MTSVAFHTGVPDPVDYACRLLRKAYRQGARLVVTAPVAPLDRLDQALWLFEQEEFVPHLRLRRKEDVTERNRRTPVWLSESATVAVDATVWVNLGADPEVVIDGFERVIEVVGDDGANVEAGRRRWRRYVASGLTPVNHPFGRTAPEART